MPKARDEQVDVAAEGSGKSERDTRPRLSIILDEKGDGPDIQRMKPEMREKMRVFLSKKENLQAFGLTPNEVPVAMKFADEFLDTFFQTLMQFERILALIMPPHVPSDISAEHFVLTTEELTVLRDPARRTAERLAKRYPWLFKVAENQDPIILLAAFSTFTSVKWKAAKAATIQRRAEQAEAEAGENREVSIQ